MQTNASTESTTVGDDAGVPLRIPTLDGASLGATLFQPAQSDEARATVVIHGATAVPQRYYRRFALFLSRRGHRVLTYDYRGIGASRGRSPRAERATMRQWGERDVEAAFGLARAMSKGAPVVAIGHSFGGQTIGLCDAWRGVDAAVIVASQLGYYGHFPAPDRYRHAITWYVTIPAVTAAFGYLPGFLGLGADLPKGVAREWAKWCRHPSYLLGYEPRARERFSRFDAPTLFFSFSDDAYAPGRAVDALLATMPHKALHHVRVTPEEMGAPIGHFGFFRPASERSLWSATLEWLEGAIVRRRD